MTARRFPVNLWAATLLLSLLVVRCRAQQCPEQTKKVEACFAQHFAFPDELFRLCSRCYNKPELEQQLESGAISELKYAVEVCANGRTCARACGPCYREMNILAACSWSCFDSEIGFVSTPDNPSPETSNAFDRPSPPRPPPQRPAGSPPTTPQRQTKAPTSPPTKPLQSFPTSPPTSPPKAPAPNPPVKPTPPSPVPPPATTPSDPATTAPTTTTTTTAAATAAPTVVTDPSPPVDTPSSTKSPSSLLAGTSSPSLAPSSPPTSNATSTEDEDGDEDNRRFSRFGISMMIFFILAGAVAITLCCIQAFEEPLLVKNTSFQTRKGDSEREVCGSCGESKWETYNGGAANIRSRQERDLESANSCKEDTSSASGTSRQEDDDSRRSGGHFPDEETGDHQNSSQSFLYNQSIGNVEEEHDLEDPSTGDASSYSGQEGLDEGEEEEEGVPDVGNNDSSSFQPYAYGQPSRFQDETPGFGQDLESSSKDDDESSYSASFRDDGDGPSYSSEGDESSHSEEPAEISHSKDQDETSFSMEDDEGWDSVYTSGDEVSHG